ncbi:hypothetical protein SAMN04487970_103550 [Paenibacillus tianmuensis]|uniref:Major Facilitator Superfamily protein n=1 Tax=Paenibacillus tianmuensis TaxID=624147 RepID=A0A1G4SV04_9BACL|nr:hypothetical protein SAMN04487970_103550 [Paenibacillus tianmuensis]
MKVQGGPAPTAQQAVRMDVKPTVFRILLAISLVHLFNDTIQAVIPAILPILKDKMSLSYMQSGVIVFALNMTASVMQPVVGFYSDRKPMPYMLPIGMSFTFLGVLGLSLAPNYALILADARQGRHRVRSDHGPRLRTRSARRGRSRQLDRHLPSTARHATGQLPAAHRPADVLPAERPYAETMGARGRVTRAVRKGCFGFEFRNSHFAVYWEALPMPLSSVPRPV